MKIAVTGSGGMIGTMLVSALREKNHKVIECTRRNCNILELEQVKKAIKGAEVVVHCAAQLDEEAPNLYEVNVTGTENVLEACTANGIGQFIFLSTVGVFGQLRGLKDENTEPRPETPYEKSKLEAEKRVLSFQEVFHVTILRPAIVIGNNKYWQQIIRPVVKGFPLIGDGQNHFQTSCPEDIADAIIFCMGREECYGEIFIVAEKNAQTLEQTANIVRKEFGMQTPIGKIPLWLGNIIVKINYLIKFSPILKSAYVKRLQADRFYSTKKLMGLGWKAKCSAASALPKLVKLVSAQNKK